MNRYRQGRGCPSLDVPDLPTKEQFDKSYKSRWGDKSYPSKRLGDIPRESLWEEILKMNKSRSMRDRKWMQTFLRDFGFRT